MDFKAVIIFLCLYFIRPQDWIPGLEGTNLVTPVMAIALLAMLTRARGFDPKELLRTPIDWMILAYYLYIVFTSAEKFDTFKEAFPLFAFYLTTRQAISDQGRLTTFLRYWTVLIVLVGGMAVATIFGLDITRAASAIAKLDGRLLLNTWMFNNPNDLGHSVVVAIPLAYFLFIWKKSAASMLGGLIVIALLGFCVFETQSKGAFISGFVTVVASTMFGRPKIFQVTILVVALTMGTTALFQLPRMSGLRNARDDEGIVGRLLAWEMARTASRMETWGEGWKKFEAWIEWEEEEERKATHSAYVRVGADLGYPGLYLYVGILYCGFRVLMQARTGNPEEERARRMLFAILVSYSVSGWMSNRAYHTEFFLMAGAVSAFHLLLRRRGAEAADGDEGLASPMGGLEHAASKFGFLVPVPASAEGGFHGLVEKSSSGILLEEGGIIGTEEDEARGDGGHETAAEIGGHPWRRIGLGDLIMMGLMLHLTLRTWDYIMANM